MDESGYCDTMSQHSNNANDDPTVTLTVEPVDVLIEKDGSVLLSNLQSALPGAHGLYYYQLGHKKAVKYDSQSAKIIPPSDGWGVRNYFVTLAHGCKTSWTPFGSYESASKQFERSVTLVQKMLGGVDNADSEKRKAASIKYVSGDCAQSQETAVISNLNQGNEKSYAQDSLSPEKLSRLEGTIDELTKTLAAKEHDIQLLKEEIHELRSQFNTSSFSDRSVGKENAQPSVTDFSGKLDERAESFHDTSNENKLQVQIDGLMEQLNNTQSRFDKLEQSSADERLKFESETAEVRQQWNDAKWKIGELEAALTARNADTAYKSERITQLESELGCVSNQLHESNQKNCELERILSLKQNEVDQLAESGDRLRELSESLVAHKSELTERASYLEQELIDLRALQAVSEAECNRLQQSSANDDQERVHDLKQQLADLHDSYNRLEQDRILERQKLEWELGETNQWLNDARLRTGELEENLHRKSDNLDDKDRVVDSLTAQLQETTKDLDECRRALGDLEDKYSEVKNKKEYVEQELSAAKKHLANNAQTPPRKKSDQQDDVLELSDELMKVNMRKYELENNAAQLSSDLRSARLRADQLEATQQETAKNLWLTAERLTELEREQHRLQHELNEAHRFIDQLKHELSQQDNRLANDLPEVHHLQEELRAARESFTALAASETEARQKLEWRLGELTQAWNDAKWKIGEMEAAVAQKQLELDQARHRVYELEQLLEKLQNFKSKATKVLEGSFLIRKQPYVDRTKWSLSMWDENTPADGDLDYRRVWFDIDAPNVRNVYLMGSFVNWECGLMCTATENSGNRKGVWVDLPRGRYEFRFLVDGDWRTAEDFPTCSNDFGSENNWRFVD